MKSFMEYDFTISEIELCAKVNHGTPVHRGRKSHGLVFYPERGCVFSFLNGPVIKPEENSIVYLPKNSDYNVTNKTSSICYAINFQIADNTVFSPFYMKVKNHSGILRLFREADKAFASAGANRKMKCKACLCEVISTLQHEYSLGYISGERREIISAALEKIHGNYTEEDLNIAGLSKLCGITPEYFRSIFVKIYGVPPSKYIANLRISRAKELLSSGMYSVSETAHMCGFEDVSYFSRCFSRITGVAPSEYNHKSGVDDFG